MVQSGSKWPKKAAQSGPKWSKAAQSDPEKWSNVARMGVPRRKATLGDGARSIMKTGVWQQPADTTRRTLPAPARHVAILTRRPRAVNRTKVRCPAQQTRPCTQVTAPG